MLKAKKLIALILIETFLVSSILSFSIELSFAKDISKLAPPLLLARGKLALPRWINGVSEIEQAMWELEAHADSNEIYSAEKYKTTVQAAEERIKALLGREGEISVALKALGVSEEEIEAIFDVLRNPREWFNWFDAPVWSEDHYLLQHRGGLAVNLIEFLLRYEEEEKISFLVDEYIFLGVLNRSGLTQEQIMELANKFFNRNREPLLGNAFRAFVNEQAKVKWTESPVEKLIKHPRVIPAGGVVIPSNAKERREPGGLQIKVGQDWSFPAERISQSDEALKDFFEVAQDAVNKVSSRYGGSLILRATLYEDTFLGVSTGKKLNIGLSVYTYRRGQLVPVPRIVLERVNKNIKVNLALKKKISSVNIQNESIRDGKSTQIQERVHQVFYVLPDAKQITPLSPDIPLETIYRYLVSLRDFGVKHTPMVLLKGISERTGLSVYAKDEGAQVTGSFKLRILALFIEGLKDLAKRAEFARKIKKLTTGTTGNQGQALAWLVWRLRQLYAELSKLEAVIFVATTAPLTKMARMKGFGANVISVEGQYDDARKSAMKFAEQNADAQYMAHSAESAVASYGTLGLEIVEDLVQEWKIKKLIPEDFEFAEFLRLKIKQEDNSLTWLEESRLHKMEESLKLLANVAVLVPVGAGGIASGVFVALKTLNPNITLVGVVSDRTESMYLSLLYEELMGVEIPHEKLLEDGIAVDEVEELAFRVFMQYADGIVSVPHKEIPRGIHAMYEEAKIISEGASALPYLALTPEDFVKRLRALKVRDVVLVSTGRNIDPSVWSGITGIPFPEEETTIIADSVIQLALDYTAKMMAAEGKEVIRLLQGGDANTTERFQYAIARALAKVLQDKLGDNLKQVYLFDRPKEFLPPGAEQTGMETIDISVFIGDERQVGDVADFLSELDKELLGWYSKSIKELTLPSLIKARVISREIKSMSELFPDIPYNVFSRGRIIELLSQGKV